MKAGDNDAHDDDDDGEFEEAMETLQYLSFQKSKACQLRLINSSSNKHHFDLFKTSNHFGD